MSIYIPVALRRLVLSQALGMCAYCRSLERLMGVPFEIEHIIPTAVGGATVYENLCLACPVCNRYKAVRLSGIDSVTNQLTNLFHPRQDRWNEHFAWNESGSVLIGLSPVGRVTIDCLQMNRPAIVDLRGYWSALGLHPPQLTS